MKLYNIGIKGIICSLLWIIIFFNPPMVFSNAEGYRTLTVTDIEGVIKGYLIENTPYGSEQIRVQNINMSDSILLSPEWDYEVMPAPKSQLTGRTAFSLNIKSDGRNIQTYWISANIEILVDAVMTSRTLKDRQIISEDDIYLSKKILSELPAGYVSDVKDIIGKRTKRFTGINRPITEDMVEEPPLFKRGDKVFVIAESDTLKVTTVGIASEDGIKGRPVKVLNIQSKKEVFGEVMEDGIVKVRW
ncbi:MAG TPA: flagella basal body P-ring formation protein FlgA [Nitrospiraceae bacterium]|nr:flagella basal body P-ring formation protein FlgA [Nitrospiraceae bacterium]